MSVGAWEAAALQCIGSPASCRRQSWGAAEEPAGAMRASQIEERPVQLLDPASLTSGHDGRTGPAGSQSVFGYSWGHAGPC